MCLIQVGQYKYTLNAQYLRLFGLHSDVNDAHRAGANRLQNKTKTLWSSVDKCCQVFGPVQQSVQGQEVSPSQLTSAEVIQLAIPRRVFGQALELPDVGPLLASLAVPQQLLSEADGQVGESPKK